jgi:tetratricopeptide (TPR) repeat protein
MNWQDMEDQAWDEVSAGNYDTAARLARNAIRIEPNAIDCYNILAQGTDLTGERIAFAKEGVRLGEIQFKDEIASAPNDDYPFYGILETRPYMRALHGLALALWSDERPGAKDEAIEVAQHALQICPNDNIGFRFLLLEWLATQDRWTEGYPIAKTYGEDAMVPLRMWASLYRFQAGELDYAKERLDAALQYNPHIVKELIKKKRSKLSPMTMVAHGSIEEAQHYASTAYEIWRNVPGAIEWLKTASK